MELVKSMKSKNWKNESKHKTKIKLKENSKKYVDKRRNVKKVYNKTIKVI